MIIGYCRVSTQEQGASLQEQKLRQAGAEKIFREEISGGSWDRPELHRMFEILRPGDTVVVWKLDRLSPSLKDLLWILELLEELGVGFKSLKESIDTTTPAGRMMMQMILAFAEFERAMILERTAAGIVEAREKCPVGGRCPELSLEQRREALEMLKSGKRTVPEVARLLSVHPSTVWGMLLRAEAA